ncbi:purine nucleoside phosphorylase [Methanocella paludicola SANAE]|uniref:Probable 6-oxopurine nucleoside phosphorylase n=1 Tax=Methanocella paludicola (strain DSM 17711 / JCM 13418 / NBRC 101707 / SANAE) TaxID=304371 RepID=D1Z1A3_METPS|nr:S-methyl-5'-thioadenosine phosphorylase [Methanocella paludicola]BAI62475.1 purine nucleoside phosphorylase [Methanocella paludicola SANAE]
MPRTAVIGGTGFYDMAQAALKEKKAVDTKYGRVIVSIYQAGGEEFAFLPRHSEGHTRAPHTVNYRANIMALKQLGVERIIGVCSVGSLRKHIKPGDFVLVDQFLDFTKSRPSTFFDEEGHVVHTNVTEPYCAEMRECIAEAMPLKHRLHKKGTYVCAEGPRFETAAEIRMFAALGGDVVGMTGVPECVLARELGICYACIAVVTNYAAGISDEPVSHEEVLEEMEKLRKTIQGFVIRCLPSIPEKTGCGCKDACH